MLHIDWQCFSFEAFQCFIAGAVGVQPTCLFSNWKSVVKKIASLSGLKVTVFRRAFIAKRGITEQP
jgi:hypothetical protein